MLRHKLFSIMTAVSLFASQGAYAKTKQARPNDVADSYVLTSGNLFRMVKGNKCQITNNVKDFKVSQHPNDLAMIYFEKGGDLYMLRNAADLSGNCPKAEKKVLVKSIKKYSVIPSTKSIIVNITLSNSGLLQAWDNNKVISTQSNVAEYKVNNTFGKAGDVDADTIAFIRDNQQNAYKINGKVETKPEKAAGNVLVKILAAIFNIAMESIDTEAVVASQPVHSTSTMIKNIKKATYSWDKFDAFKKDLRKLGKLPVATIKDVLDEFSSDQKKFDVIEHLVDAGKMPNLSGSDITGILAKFSFNSKKFDVIKNVKKQIKSVDGDELIDIIVSVRGY